MVELKYFLIFTRLQRLMVSLSHSGAIALMDNIAEGHDEEVLEWQEELSQMLRLQAKQITTTEVSIHHTSAS